MKNNGSLLGGFPVSNGVRQEFVLTPRQEFVLTPRQVFVLTPTLFSIFVSILLREAKEKLPDFTYIRFPTDDTYIRFLTDGTYISFRTDRKNLGSCLAE